VQPHLGFEDEPAAVPEDEFLGGFEFFRDVLLPHHEHAVPQRHVHLHRADRGPGREPRLLLRHQRREAGEFREPRHRTLPICEVAAVEVEPPLQEVLSGLVHDLPVREVRLPPPLDEPVRVAPELEVDAELRRLPREVRHRERVAAVREEHIRVDRADGLADAPHHGLLVPVERDVVEASAEQPVAHPRDSEGRVHVQLQEGRPQGRDRVVEGELLLLRPPSATHGPHETEWEDPLRLAVPLAEPEVDVEQPVVVVPAVRIDDVGEFPEIAVVARDDFEHGNGVLDREVDSPLRGAGLLHRVEDLDALRDCGQLVGVRMEEERHGEVSVFDALRALRGPQPQDHRIAVVVWVCVDEPALRGDSPAVAMGGA